MITVMKEIHSNENSSSPVLPRITWSCSIVRAVERGENVKGVRDDSCKGTEER
jgi:hypothetical protein